MKTIYTPRTVYRWIEADHEWLRTAWRTRRCAVGRFDRTFAQALSLERSTPNRKVTISDNVVRNKRCAHGLTTRSLDVTRLAGFSADELRAELAKREAAS